MAGILEKVLSKEINSQDVIDWLLGTDSVGEPSRILCELSDVKEDFVPFLLNFLRDQTLYLIQGCRSTTTTPAKTPSSLRKLKKKPTSTPVHQTHKSKRVQLFSSPGPWEFNEVSKTERNPVSASGSDVSFQSRDSIGGFTNRTNWGNYTGEVRGSSRPTKSPQSHNTPPDNGRYRNKQSLGDFFCTPENEQCKKKSPLGTLRDEGTRSPHSGRRSGNRKGHSSEKKAKQNSRIVEQNPPVFKADDFPPVGSSSGKKTNVGLPSGAQIITSSRRIATTLISPKQNNSYSSKDNSIFKLSREISAPSPRSAWLSPVDPRNGPRSLPLSLVSPPPGMIVQGGLKSIPEIGRSPSSPWSRPLVDKNTSKAVRRVELNTLSPSQIDDAYDSPIFKRVPETENPTPSEATPIPKFNTPKKTVTISEPDSETPSKTPCVTPGKGESFTPTKSLLERLLSTEVVQADSSSVTHQEELGQIAHLYSGCMQNNLAPNITVELYFLTQLLTARGSEAEPHNDLAQDLDEILYFSSIHNAVYFAVIVLAQQKRLVSLLDRSTLRLLADNQRIADFLPSFKEELNIMYENTTVKATVGVSYPSPVGGVSFQADTDNKKNFPSERCFHMFKKQRDGFYELLREWEENHLTAGWSMVELQGEKVRRLIGYRTELANHVHFSRLFLSQLIQMCKGDQSVVSEGVDEANISLLSELKLTNPEKLKRLKERFTTPSSIGGPCPPPSFPGCQEFFRDFIVAASSHVFNQHLLDSMTSKIADLNATPFSSPETDLTHEEEMVDAEDKEALISCLLDVKLIGKFLGYVTFLPYQSPEALPESMTSSFMAMRNQTAQSMDVLLYLKTAQLEGRLVLTLPWVVEYLSMMDSVAPKLDYFQLVFILLTEIYRQAGRLLTLRGRRTQLLEVAILGWLFELPIFPPGLFFKDYPYLSDTEFIGSLPKGCLDLMDLVDQQMLFICCPYLGELKSLLVDFAVGTSSRNHNVRKITPVSTKPLVTSSVSEKQLQHQMEDNLFHNHPASLKRTVEFVADRVASNQIKQFRSKMFPQLLEEGYEKARVLAAPFRGQSPDSRSKRKMAEQLDQLASQLSQKSKNANLAAGKSYCEEKARTILPLLLPEEVSAQVLDISTQIAVRIAQEKINNWFNTHITNAMYKREFTSEVDKQLRAQSVSEKSVVKTSAKNIRSDLAVSLPCQESPSPHCQEAPSPSDGVLLLKELLRDLLIEDHNYNIDGVCKVLTSVGDMLQYRQDVLPMVKKSLGKMTTDLCYMIIIERHDLWSSEVEEMLNQIWQKWLTNYLSFSHMICSKHMCLLEATPNRKECEERLVKLAVSVLRLRLSDVADISTGCLTVLQNSPTKGHVAFLAVFLHEIAKIFSLLSITGEDLKSFNSTLDLLSAYQLDKPSTELLHSTRCLVSKLESSVELALTKEQVIPAKRLPQSCALVDMNKVDSKIKPESHDCVTLHVKDCDHHNDNLVGLSQVGVEEILSNLPVMPTNDNREAQKSSRKPQSSQNHSSMSAKENLSR